MISLSLAQIAAAVKGSIIGDAHAEIQVTGLVETDSRLVTSGALFFAKLVR